MQPKETEQWTRFGILCALAVYREPGYMAWAEAWLSGADRSPESAQAARHKIPLITDFACQAARQATLAVKYAALAATSPAAISKKYAVMSANNAALAARYAYWEKPSINLVALAEQACS